jgi:hypothetical protein
LRFAEEMNGQLQIEIKRVKERAMPKEDLGIEKRESKKEIEVMVEAMRIEQAEEMVRIVA